MSIKNASEVTEEWLQWPGEPFHWRPCDSPIEDSLFHELYKFASDHVEFTGQSEIKTYRGTFRLDFILRHRTTGRKIAIECDGKAFHILANDSLRDSAILRTGLVAAIYRAQGKDCYYCPLNVLQLIAQMEPWIVTEKFREIAACRPHPSTYQDDELEGTCHGYRGIMRSYYEPADDSEERSIDCSCEGDCDCNEPEMISRRDRTPTIVRYMTAPGHPSAFERPERVIPLAMPEWKVALAAKIRAEE